MCSSTMNSGEPPFKKKNNNVLIEPTLNTSLPDDLVVSCLARVPRLHYPTLALVSKSFQSLLTSTKLYKTRLLLDRTETCLYVCLRFPPDPNPRWFTLHRKPDRTLTKVTSKKKNINKKKSSGNVLALIPVLHPPTVEWSSLISVGPFIYAIRGPDPSPKVSFLDCRTHKWCEAPSMRLASPFPISRLEGKMYLAGVCGHHDALYNIEVFDIKTQTWKTQEKQIFKCKNRQGKIFMISNSKGVAFNLNAVSWEIVELDNSYCTIKNIRYCYSTIGKFLWYDTMLGDWRTLHGLHRLPKFARHSNVILADYDGKMAVFWTKYLRSSGNKNKMIWGAEIVLERRKTNQIWGKVCWLDGVLTVPATFEFMNIVAANL